MCRKLSGTIGIMDASNPDSDVSYEYTDAHSFCSCEEQFPSYSSSFAPWLATTRRSYRQCTCATSRISNAYHRPPQKNSAFQGGSGGQRQPVLPPQKPSQSQMLQSSPAVPYHEQTIPAIPLGYVSIHATTPSKLPTKSLSNSHSTAMSDTARAPAPTPTLNPTTILTQPALRTAPLGTGQRMDYVGYGRW